MKFKKGFTLIELLVVVAIIGILASVVIGFLVSARNKGNDTAVKSNLATVRTASELYYLNNNNSYFVFTGFNTTFAVQQCPQIANFGSYPGLALFSDPSTSGALKIALSKGNQAAGYEAYCYNNANVWAVAIGLNENTSKTWCVDNKPSVTLKSTLPSASIDPVNLCN